MKLEEQCNSCKGTGLYVGFAERGGTAVVCSNCKGTGKFVLEYIPFAGKQDAPKVTRVFEHNPGFSIGRSIPGGMPYEDWKAGKKFPKGSEMRTLVCPHWWYHGTMKWKECDENLSQRFADCALFHRKEKCWEKFDEVGRGDAK